MVAFAVLDFIGKEPKDDPKLVTWIPQIIASDGTNVLYRINLGFGKCTEKDFKKFNKASKKSE